jgi:hypothetical protein
MGGGVEEDNNAPEAWLWDGFFLCGCCKAGPCGGRGTAVGGGGPVGGSGWPNGAVLTVEVGGGGGCGAEGMPPEGIMGPRAPKPRTVFKPLSILSAS